MGLIDFVLSAGEKLFGGDAAAAAPPTDDVVLSKRATTLEDRVRSLGLAADDLKIKVAGDTAVVKGKVATQEICEKIVLAVGNTAGIAKVDDRLEVASAEPEARYVTVQKGDTLSKISKEQYGDANRYQKIFEANRPMLKDPDKIYPGQVLRIPA
ncbi:MAG TPA: peptidoglycan-binding protein LysM [Candidatus Binatia bacterium]|jgi:nucleoid-associated protein YgaU|nr:peptidoglycan-binding protein LysM [Candidatus Binatia bacterium]